MGISSFCGFLFAGFLGIYRFFTEPATNLRGRPFASGYNYFPQTVSEMVHDNSEPAGKCFFAFSLIGAICILLSWYPWQLRNVWVGYNSRDPIFGYVRWLNLRQFLPPIGMMIVTCVQETPLFQANAREKVATWIHTMGAIMMFGGYIVLEIHALAFSQNVRIRQGERVLRWACIVTCILSAISFEALGGLFYATETLGLCCSDQWAVPTSADIAVARQNGHLGSMLQDMTSAELHRKELVDTASGAVLALKVCEYLSEVVAGLAMILSHLVIWFYCPERNLDLRDELPDPGTYILVDKDEELAMFDSLRNQPSLKRALTP